MWKKILLGIAAAIVVIVVLVLVFTKSLTEVANKQLTALRAGDIAQAYTVYTSKDFQAGTSQKDFEVFLSHYPSLKNNKGSSWSERSISNNTGILKGSLTSNDGAVTPVEYHFVKENDEWKILSIVVQPTGTKIAQQDSQSTTDAVKPADKSSGDASLGEIHHVLLSDTQGSDRSVSDEVAKKVIPASAPKVYVSAYISHAKAGVKVIAEMVRLENGAKIGPSEATITQSGNVIRDFSFTNEATTWPTGDYRINVTTSNGQATSVDFKIQ